MSTQTTADSEYRSKLLDIWTRAVDPKGVGMVEAMASELAAFTGQSVPEVLECMSAAHKEFTELWHQRGINPADSGQVESFYSNQFVEAYELADWHCGRANGYPPLSYAHAAYVARERGLKRALDFGSGIGTGALALQQAGCEVECADVANELLRFVGHRVKQRGLHVDTIDLLSGGQPKTGYYDIITCFDVLEHVPDPRAKLLEVQTYLRPGGHLVVNLMRNSFDPNKPMHVSSAPNWLEWIRKSPLVPDWSMFFEDHDGPIQVFVKQRLGLLRNRAGALIDSLQGVAAGGGSGQ